MGAILALTGVMAKYALFLAAALAFAQGTADPFPGIYAGKDLQLELRSAGPGVYSGTIHVQGQSFPVDARNVNQRLNGTFTSGANRFAFQATLRNGKLRLVSDNNEYILLREMPAAAHEHPRGFSLRPAAGWTARNNEQGILLIPAGATNEEVYVAALQDGYSPAEEAKMVRQLSQSFVQNGGQVRRSGERQGSAYYWEVADARSGQVGGIKIYYLPEGARANVIIALGPASLIQSRDNDLSQMLASIRSATPKPAEGSAPAQQWQRKLQGKMIRQFHAYQGMSSDKRHYLDADGTYSFRGGSMVSVDVSGASGMSSGRNARQGRWRIAETEGGVFLHIQYNDGGTARYRLTQDARNWYMNGEKAFAVDPE